MKGSTDDQKHFCQYNSNSEHISLPWLSPTVLCAAVFGQLGLCIGDGRQLELISLGVGIGFGSDRF